MSDVVAVAAITGGVSLMTSGVAGLVTFAVSKNASRVELAKLNAENERLLQEAREEERRNRQTAYYELIDAYREVHQILGVEIDRELQAERTEAFNHHMAGVLLFGPPSVREGAYELNNVFEEIWPALEDAEKANPEKPFEELWRDATADLFVPFTERGSQLVPLMHADVTHGIAEDP